MQTAIRVPPDYWVVFLLWWPSWLHFKPFLKLYSLINESIAFPLSLTVIFIQKSVFSVIVNLGQVEQSFVQMPFRFICYYSALSELSLISVVIHSCVIWGSQLDSFSSKNARLRLITAFSCIRFQTSHVPSFSHRDWEPILHHEVLNKMVGHQVIIVLFIIDLFNLLAKSNYL